MYVYFYFILSHEVERKEKVELTKVACFYGEIMKLQWNQLESLYKQYKNKQKN